MPAPSPPCSPVSVVPRFDEYAEEWARVAIGFDAKRGDRGDLVAVLYDAIAEVAEVRGGENVVEFGCGNGIVGRRLAGSTKRWLATDASGTMLSLAEKRTRPENGPIEYAQLDASETGDLAALPDASFDLAVAGMMLNCLPELAPLYTTLARVLVPGGAFAVTVPHPCFNNAHTSWESRLTRDRGTEWRISFGRYIEPTEARLGWEGDDGRPPVYHRPLSRLLTDAFANGFVLDRMAEHVIRAESEPGSYLQAWREIPPLLAFRLRLGSAAA